MELTELKNAPPPLGQNTDEYNISEENKNKRIIIIIFSIIVFLFTFFTRIFYISQKTGIHIDEGFTHVIASFIDYQYKKNFDTGKIYTGKELKALTFQNNTSFKEALKDVKALRKNNNGNKDHTPLYHTCYLLWMQGGDGILTPEDFINKACSLNLLFFILEFFIMYKILQKLFPGSFVIIPGLTAAFLTTGSISNTLMVRPYQIQELAFVFLAYVFIDNFQKINVKESIINAKNGFLITFSIAFTLLTGYFAGIYIIFLGSVLIFSCIKNKMYKNLLFLFSCMVPAIILVFAFYPGFLKGFRAHEVRDINGLISITDTKLIKDILFINLKHLSNILVSYIMYIPLIIVMLAALAGKRNKYEKLSLILFITALIFSAIIIYIAPFKVLRYAAPVLPLMSLIVPMLLYSTNGFYKKVLSVISILIITIYAAIPYSSIGYDWSPQYSDGNYFRPKIENINDTEYKQFKFIAKPEIPVIIVNNPGWAYCLNIIFNMDDNQKYEFTDDIKNIPDKYNHYFLLVEKMFVKSKARKFNLPKNHVIVDTFTPARFDGYEVVKK